MEWITCPVCRKSWLSWNARSQLFVCLSPECQAVYRAPAAYGLDQATIARLISQGQVPIDPGWFTEQLRVQSPEQCRLERKIPASAQLASGSKF